MKILFVESRMFTSTCRKLLKDETLAHLQRELLDNPEKGAVMEDCGGLRKVRVEEPNRGRGKRGGCRVIYLHIREVQRIDLIAVYSKEERDDLTSEQRKVLKALAEKARTEALRKVDREGRRQK